MTIGKEGEDEAARAEIDGIDFAKGGGLVPVVTQEAKTGQVLMLAYANREAVELTMKTGFATYWSRSRNELWKKGQDSGHVQRVQKVMLDCDSDTLLYLVDQTGPACHTGNHTCFFREMAAEGGSAQVKEESGSAGGGI